MCDIPEHQRAPFEETAAKYGFDLTRSPAEAIITGPWDEYVDVHTGYYWAGWLAAADHMVGDQEPTATTVGRHPDNTMTLVIDRPLPVGTPLFAAPRTTPYGRGLERAHGDLLPPIDSIVQLYLNSTGEWVDHTVVGYFAWPAYPKADGVNYRVGIRVLDRYGFLNARFLDEIKVTR